MGKIFKLTIKSALRDPFLLFWSIILPLGGTIGLGYFVKVTDYDNRITVGMIATSVIFYALMTTSYAILSQRRRGVYNLLRITPLSLPKYIISCSSAWMLVCTVCGFIIYIPACLIFRLEYSFLGSILIIPVILIASLGYIFGGFILASISKNESHLSMITNIIIMPLLFASDAYYSLHKVPKVVRAIIQINPFQIFINALRSSLTLHYKNYLLGLLFLTIYLLIGLALATKTFRFSDK